MNRSKLIFLLLLVLSAQNYSFAQQLSTVFEKASSDYRLSFPGDHGAHLGFQTEWWYLTGHAVIKGQPLFSQPSRFGFQLTFFRRALSPQGGARFNQYFFAHGALSDPEAAEFLSARRAARSNLGLADASTDSLNVFINDWKIGASDNNLQLEYAIDAANSVKLSGKMPNPVPQGEAGYSRKGPRPDSASHYYSIPRIALSGTVVRAGVAHQVSALGWLDHEFMSNALAANQAGWDWFSVTLKNGDDLMLFRMRSDSGDDYWSGSIIKSGVARVIGRDEFSIKEIGSWKSTKSGATYPSGWKIILPSENISLELRPILEDQEQHDSHRAGPSYWEGAVQDLEAEAIGYVELTGYDAKLGAKL